VLDCPSDGYVEYVNYGGFIVNVALA